jgi:hypothetical protein
MDLHTLLASRSLARLRRFALATCAVSLTALAACATPSASAQDVELDDEVELTFSSIDVEDRDRRLEVDYRLEDRDWRWAQDQEFDLWLTLYAPQGDDYAFVHGMPLESYRGRVLFPSHVRYYDYPYVGLCVVAVGVGQQYDPGYGYVCDDPVRVNVHSRQRVNWSHNRVIFSLGFHSGLYGYSWFHPHYGFYYPRHFYGPYPPIIIRDRYRRHYHPRRHYRRHPDRYKGDRHNSDRYRGDRHRSDRYKDDRRRPRHETRRHVDGPGTRSERKDDRQPTRVIRPQDRIVPTQKIAPRQRRIEPKQRIQPRPTQIRPRQRQIQPKQRVQPRPTQIRPQQRQIQPKQQIRQKQIRQKQIRQKQVRPQQRRIKSR